MFIIALLLLFVNASLYQNQCDPFFSPEACDRKSIAFKRQVFYNGDHREMSVYMRAHSSESIIIHCLLIFSDDIYYFHNTLRFSPTKVSKYEKILRRSDFPFNNELLVITKGFETLLQYDVALLPSYVENDYDAILSLDYFASLWNEYNTFIIERSRLTLRMIEPDQWNNNDKEDFMGFYKVWCDRAISLKYCHVNLSSNQMSINDELYNNYSLVINTQSNVNLLPPDLFVYWQFGAHKNLKISVGDEMIIELNTQFNYGINEQSSDIVLGVDIFHYFQKVEYGIEAGYYKLFYTTVYNDNDAYALHKLLITIFIGTILSTLFYWIMSPNYDIWYNLLKGDTTFQYPVRQVSFEILNIVVAFVLWIMTVVFTPTLTSSAFDYYNSYHKQRMLLYIALSVFNTILLTLYLISQRVLTLSTIQYCYTYATTWKECDKTTRTVTAPSVIVRNIAILVIMACNLSFILNYLSEEKLIYAFPLVILALAIIFYYTKYIMISLIYIIIYNKASSQARFIFLTLANIMAFSFFLVFSMQTIFMAFFNEVNSMYSESLLWDFIITLTCVDILMGICSVMIPLFRDRLSRQKRNKTATKVVESHLEIKTD